MNLPLFGGCENYAINTKGNSQRGVILTFLIIYHLIMSLASGCFTFKGQLANNIKIVKAHTLQIKKFTPRNVVFINTCK